MAPTALSYADGIRCRVAHGAGVATSLSELTSKSMGALA
ncbi:Hypothetical protein, partial CDS, partial [Neorhizobium galegae bv. officinalis]